jgi:hypothetical protein
MATYLISKSAQSLGLSMFGNMVLMFCFASTLGASWRTQHTADVATNALFVESDILVAGWLPIGRLMLLRKV